MRGQPTRRVTKKKMLVFDNFDEETPESSGILSAISATLDIAHQNVTNCSVMAPISTAISASRTVLKENME